MVRFLAPILFIGFAAASPAAALTQAEQQEVQRIQAFVNGLRTFKADFTQVSPSGRSAKGTMYIQRPGRLRVEYEPPIKTRIFATPQWLIVEDCKAREPQYLPLRATPAGLLVQKDIQFSGDLTVTEVKKENRWLTLRIVETRSPGKGSINLVFQQSPMQLVGWTVVDAQGQPTQVTFENIQTDKPIDPYLFGFVSKCY